ncbi:MAG: penicillin-binding transpeptidase domain-containing protein [Oscillospiraceae bacterium]|nr:penicillin-binding transpeptidase domain-containing protein [Oscillospiraceae bacterium]
MTSLGPNVRMKKRMIFCIIALSIAGTAVILLRLFQLQMVQAEDLQRLAAQQQMRVTSISSQRGTIRDRNGNILAKSGTVWTVYLSPVDIDNEEERQLIAEGLADILDVTPEFVLEKSRRNTYYEIIKRKIERPLADEITQFLQENKITAVGLEEDYKRYYPYGSLASTVLGFTGMENQGAYGIEAYYDKVLSGTPGRVVSAKNAWGTDMPFKYEKMYEAKDGNDIVLTIDVNIQQFLEKHLEQAVIEHNVQNKAAGVVIDVQTGEILAMSTKPDFDPNTPNQIYDSAVAAQLDEMKTALEGMAEGEAREQAEQEYRTALSEAQFDQWRNKVISDPYEPGSVFKIITASAALEEKTMNLGSAFNCTGNYELLPGVSYNCWKAGGHGHQNFAQALQNSCNPAFIMIGQSLGQERFRKYFEAFGLMETTGVDLPGESGSIYHTEEDFSVVSLASSSFGQTFKVTPLQLITAVSAAFNGGELMQPYVVKQIVDSDGNTVEEKSPVAKRQVISAETSATIASLCESVVSQGSGKNAYIPGYRIGGKTGTSEKLDKQINGEVDKRISSFMGFAPADDPQIAVLIMLDEPYMTNPYGSVIAAPVVKNIMADVLPYLGIEPEFSEAEQKYADVAVPNLNTLKRGEAEAELNSVNLKARFVGEGETVVGQLPQMKEEVPRGSTVILYTDGVTTLEDVEVPDVLGRTSLQANAAILAEGLNIRLDGVADTGQVTQVISQDPAPGTVVKPGTVVTVEIIATDLTD